MTPGSPRRAVWVAAGLGFCAGLFFVSRLADSLPRDEGKFFLLLSPLVAVVAAMVQQRATAVGSRGRRLGIAVAALGLGGLAYLALDACFVIRNEDARGSIATIIDWQRHPDCVCDEERDGDCTMELIRKAGDEQGLKPEFAAATTLRDRFLDKCWPERDHIELALKLAHFLTLVGIGGVAGLPHAGSGGQPVRGDRYLDLRLWIDSQGEDVYAVNARTLEGSSRSETFTLPASLRGPEPDELGSRLFEAVFRGDVLHFFCLARDRTRTREQGLRIRLVLQNAPRLAALPWELLYHRHGEGFLALSCETPVVRGLEQVEPYRRLEIEPPLRVLLTIAQPAELDPLDVEREVRTIERALEPLIEKRLVELERVRSGSWEDVSMRLDPTADGDRFHVFHFIGHGGLTAGGREGALAFESPGSKEVRTVTGELLAKQLTDHGTFLAVLNACEGARVPQQQPLAGVAQTLVARGVPAVVAMQDAMSDDTAIELAYWFYYALAVGYPVDAALSRVRRQLYGLPGSGDAWSTPVLYLHASTGRLFDVARKDPDEWLGQLRAARRRKTTAVDRV